MEDIRLLKLQHFFEVDLKIKKEMLNNAPPGFNQYVDVDKYADNVNDSLIYMFSELKCIATDIFGVDSSVMNKVVMMESDIKKAFYSCGYDMNRLRSFYASYVTDLDDKEFLNSVKEECVGYTFGTTESANGARTINEMLHFMHSYVMNNESILKAIPAIGQKKNSYNYPITLRGANVPIFNELFTSFPDDMDVGWTDMVAINERKLMMMVRDRGHALTMEVTLDSQNARVEYFIPKLCNIEMINNLPGISNKVNEDSVGATGAIEIPKEELSTAVFDFISRVPMDKDMVSMHR